MISNVLALFMKYVLRVYDIILKIRATVYL